MIRIHLFGTVLVERDGTAIDLPALTMSRAVFVYLALHTGSVLTRDQLIDQFWPDVDVDIARQRLRRCLHELRSAIGDPLVTERQNVLLQADSVWVDAIEFSRLVQVNGVASPEHRRANLERALSNIRGDLLAGFFEDCLIKQRQLFQDLRLRALIELAGLCEQAGDFDAAIQPTREALEIDPLSEENHCVLMRLQALSGRPSDVLKQFQELERILREELDEAPSDSTRALMQDLRQTARDVAVSRSHANGSHNGHNGGQSPAVRSRRRYVPHAIFAASVLGLAFWISSHNFHGVATGPPVAAQVTTRAVREQPPLWIAPYEPLPDEINSEPNGMALDKAGNIYVTGFVDTKHNDVDFLTMKYSPEGKLLWRQRYNGTGNDVDRARAIVLDAGGNVYVTGDSDNGKGNGASRLSGLDIVTIKYDTNGNKVWEQRWNGAADGEDAPNRMALTADGGVVIAGREGGVSKDGKLGFDMPVLLKYAPDGRLDWTYRLPTDQYHSGSFWDVAVDSGGAIYAAGEFTTTKNFVDNRDLRITKVAAGGEMLWEQHYGAPKNGHDKTPRLAVGSDGSVTVAARSYTGDPVLGGGSDDILTFRYDPAGNLLWKQLYDGMGYDDGPEAVAVDPHGAAIVGGWTHTKHHDDFVVLKYDAAGRLLWKQIHNGPGNFDDRCYDLAVDAAGNIAATGKLHGGSAPAGTDWDFFTAKYDPAGTMVWRAVWDRNHSGDIARCVRFDPQGNVVVVGQGDNGKKYAGIVLIKYPR